MTFKPEVSHILGETGAQTFVFELDPKFLLSVRMLGLWVRSVEAASTFKEGALEYICMTVRP